MVSFDMFKELDEYINTERCMYVTSAGVKSIINLKTKIIEIGDWDMNANDGVSVAHGLSDYTKIISVKAMIRPDAGNNETYPLCDVMNNFATDGVEGGILRIDATNIDLRRFLGGFFDSVSFDSTSYNRGWVIIKYME